MIVRILGAGQWDVPDRAFDELDALDDALVRAVDEGGFGEALGTLLAAVRRHGSALPDDVLAPSALVLPPADATVDEVRALCAGEGLIPGRPS